MTDARRRAIAADELRFGPRSDESRGVLRRASRLVRKRGRDLHLEPYIAYRNHVRPRFHHDRETRAQMLGFVTRRLSPDDLVSWRQDRGQHSPHPSSRGDLSVARYATAAA